MVVISILGYLKLCMCLLSSKIVDFQINFDRPWCDSTAHHALFPALNDTVALLDYFKLNGVLYFLNMLILTDKIQRIKFCTTANILHSNTNNIHNANNKINLYVFVARLCICL